MDKRFEKRLATAKNPRVRKHNRKPSFARKFKRPSSNVEAFLSDLEADGKSPDRRITGFDDPLYAKRLDLVDAAAAPVTLAAGLAFAAIEDGIEAVERRLKKKARLAALEKRRKYYAAEKARRAKQREQIQAAKPAPEHPCPTPEVLMAAYCRRHENDERARIFGGLMIDLEEHERRQYQFEDKRLTKSTKGVKEWLQKNCPILAEHYQVCQRYKRIAQAEPRDPQADVPITRSKLSA